MLDKILTSRHFYNVYILSLFVLSLIIIATEQQVLGALLFGIIILLALFLFSDLFVFLIPMLFLSVFVTVCYDSYSTFIKFLPLAPIVVIAFAFNVIKYKIRFKIGSSFWGLLAVSIAVLLGGIGKITPSEYFAPTSIFYMLALGFGMVFLYFFFSSRVKENSPEILAKAMYAVGMLAALVIVFHYIKNWQLYISDRKFLLLQASNNLSTFMMLAMPFPFYFAQKHSLSVVSALFMYICMAISSSRGGLLMGGIELVALIIIYTFCYQKKTSSKITNICFLGLICLAAYMLLPEVILRISDRSLIFAPDNPTFSQIIHLTKRYFFAKEEHRFEAIRRGISDFLENPIFGTGIGYTGNQDLYNPRTGAMNWYHMWTAQIVGGLGAVGIMAYGYQLVSRVILYFKNRSAINMTFFCSYFGLWLMSQVNPGEFCPFPYALLAVIYFILIEAKNENTKALPNI